MSLALAHVEDRLNAARGALPGAVVGGWCRIPESAGTALVWAEFDRPGPGFVTAWRSRQAAEAGEFECARVLSRAEFAQSLAEPPMSQADARALVGAFKQMANEVTRLTERMQRLEGAVILPADLRLIAALATYTGGAMFTIKELLEHAHRAEPALLLAISEAFGGEINPRSLGKKLAWLKGTSLVGFCVERLGEERVGAIWRVTRLRV